MGGANIFIQEVANRLVGLGHTVNVVAARVRRDMYDFDTKVETISVSDLHGKDPRFWMAIPMLVKKMSDELRSCSPDVVIANHFPTYAAMLRSGLPGVWMCHEPFPFFHNRTSLGRDIKTRAFSLIASMFYSKYDIKAARTVTIIASNSSYTREAIRNVFGRNSEVVYPGFDEELLEIEAGSKRGATVLAGSPTTLMKGFEYTLKAFLNLHSRGIASQLRVVGNIHPRYRKMIQLAKHRHPSADIVVLGLVSRSELVDEYKRATLLSYPSLEEPFGIMPLEAAALGTPVIYFKSGGLLETMKDGLTGKGVRLSDSQAFLEAMEHILRDHMEIDRRSDEFLKHITNFSWDSTTHGLLKLCERAIGSHSPVSSSCR